MIDEKTIFRRSPDFADCAVDRAAVILNADQHLYFGVNRVGARIWALLETPRTTSDLVRILLGDFAVDESVCRRETESFLRQLLDSKLVVRQD